MRRFYDNAENRIFLWIDLETSAIMHEYELNWGEELSYIQ